MLYIILLLLVYLKAPYFRSIDMSLQQFMLTVRSSGQNQIYPIVSFFSNIVSTSVLIIIIAVAIWQYFQRIINAVWVIFVHFSSVMLTLLINWLSQGLHLKYPGLVLINDHILATVIIILIVLTIILPILVDQEVQLLTILLAFLWLGLVITAQLYSGGSSFTGMLASSLVALVWWEIMRIIYFACDF
ncbi:MAG: hypothetical protein ABF682_08770 [Liquorilactobacillus sp.]|uniref:hypothetical protein n=1 Tax=Liquorilactobacillus sp. TaxID=2767923 RepID=UPI0039E77CA0